MCKNTFRIMVFVVFSLFFLSIQSGFAALKDLDIPVRVCMVLEKAGALMAQQKYEEAIAVLDKCRKRCEDMAKQKPDDPKPNTGIAVLWYYDGNCELRLQNFTNAAEDFRQAVARYPEFMEAWQNLARVCYELEDYNDASKHFAKAYALSKNTAVECLYFSAVSSFMAKDYPQAVSSFQHLFADHREKIITDWKEHYVQALLADDKAKAALPLLRELIGETTGEKRTQWQEVLLYQYVELNMRKQALAYARELSREDGVFQKWWRIRANIALDQGLGEEALASLKIYGFLSELSTNEKKMFADLCLQQNIPQQAVIYYLQVLADDLDEKVLYNLIVAYRKMNQEEEALKALAQYAPKTKNPDLLMAKADVLYGMERFSEAADVYRLVARSKGTHSGQAWLMAGYAAWQCDNLDASRLAFSQAAKDKRQRKAAISAMNRLEQYL